MKFWIEYADDVSRIGTVIATGATGLAVNLALTNEILKILVSLVTIISVVTMLYFAHREHVRKQKGGPGDNEKTKSK